MKNPISNQHQHRAAPNPQAPPDGLSERADREGNFDLVEFADVPEPLVAAHIPMQED